MSVKTEVMTERCKAMVQWLIRLGGTTPLVDNDPVVNWTINGGIVIWAVVCGIILFGIIGKAHQ